MQCFTVMRAIENLGKGLWECNIAWLLPNFHLFLFTVLLIIEIWTRAWDETNLISPWR